MGRLSWDKPSVTIRTEFFKPEKGRYLHPTEPRALTHHEAARIRGFPDDYQWVGSKTRLPSTSATLYLSRSEPRSVDAC